MNSGQFQPGHEKIPGSGRQKGIPNKPRLNLANHLAKVMESEFEDVIVYLNRLRTYQPDAHFATFMKLLPYTLPRGGIEAVDAREMKEEYDWKREVIMEEAHKELMRHKAAQAQREKEAQDAKESDQ